MPEAERSFWPSRVEEVTDRWAFAALEKEWDELVCATRDEPFFRHAFLRIWLDNFAPESRLRVLLLRRGDGRLEAALPLLARRGSFHGVPVRELSSMANVHSCRFDLLAREPMQAGRGFLQHLQADGSWDLLRLTDLPEGGAAQGLAMAARHLKLPWGEWTAQQSPYLSLPASVDELRSRLHPKLKANCRRRRRKLSEQGEVAFFCHRGGLDLQARLEEGFALEAGGWKGRRGTAMAQEPSTRGFYTELAREAAYRGQLCLSFLTVGGRPVAFHFALEQGGRYLLLKPGYDEALKEYSPGQLLMEEALAHCVGKGLSEFDFLGPDMPWKRDWADRTRRHRWLFIFRDTRWGRALCAAKFRLAPAAKGAWEKWRG